MKRILNILLISAVHFISAQPIEITIVGTAHHFNNEYLGQQDFTLVQNFIVSVNPDIICIEAIPTHDTASLKEIWPKTMRLSDQLADTLPDMNIINKNIRRGAQFYAQYDIWNAYYYWFQAELMGDSLGAFTPYHRKLDNSEYGQMVFPAALKIGLDKLYAIDYRKEERVFLDYTNVVFKKLFFKFKWGPLMAYLSTQKAYKKAEKKGQLMEFINGPDFQVSFSKLINELPKRLPRSKEAEQIKELWLKRNRIMADRLISRAREEQAEKVLLTVGSAHVLPIREFLEAKGHKVKTFGEYITNLDR